MTRSFFPHNPSLPAALLDDRTVCAARLQALLGPQLRDVIVERPAPPVASLVEELRASLAATPQTRPRCVCCDERPLFAWPSDIRTLGLCAPCWDAAYTRAFPQWEGEVIPSCHGEDDEHLDPIRAAVDAIVCERLDGAITDHDRDARPSEAPVSR